MQFDAKDLRDFYRTPLGHVVRRQLASRIRGRWKRLHGMTLVGVGFAAPFLGSFRAEAARVACFMPARQGALVWPQRGRCHSVLVEEHLWPLPDNSVDRLLAVHCIEQAERVGPLLREAWRVLAPDGRLLIIVPNRRGVWSRIDSTPFGQGLPFSRTQLERLLTDGLFTPIDWSEALYFPPLTSACCRAWRRVERSLPVAAWRCHDHRRSAQGSRGAGRRRLKAEAVRAEAVGKHQPDGETR
jgi:SAM-dependent methyltransferase